MHVDIKLCRANLAPRTIMRGPGYLQGVMVIEEVLERVAHALRLDPVVVKRRNFISPPPEVRPSVRPSVLSV
jgi:xanthine dehydrogenase large subunit